MDRSAPLRLAAIAALVVVAGCASRGREFNADAVPRIRVGQTTQADIQRWFGRPIGVRVDASGRTRWEYTFEETERRDTRTLTRIGRSIGSIFGSRIFFPPVDIAYESTTEHSLEVYFDGEGRVVDYTYERRETPSRVIY